MFTNVFILSYLLLLPYKIIFKIYWLVKYIYKPNKDINLVILLKSLYISLRSVVLSYLESIPTVFRQKSFAIVSLFNFISPAFWYPKYNRLFFYKNKKNINNINK